MPEIERNLLYIRDPDGNVLEFIDLKRAPAKRP